MAADLVVPLWLEVTYDWILIVLQLMIITFHCLRVAILSRQDNNTVAKKTLCQSLDSRQFSYGVLFFALLLPINRFFAIVDVYGTSLNSCSIYLAFAMLFTSMYRLFLYEFILFRCKTYINQSNSSIISYLFYTFCILIGITELTFGILAFTFVENNRIGEFDDGRCNFAADALGTYLPVFVIFDFIVSLVCLSLFLMCFRNVKQMAQSVYGNDKNSNNNDKNGSDYNNNSKTQTAEQINRRLEKLLFRIKFWSIIAMSSSLICGIITVFVDGASPIFLIGDSIFNSFCVVMQFSSVNKRDDITMSEKWAVFRYEVGRLFNYQMDKPVPTGNVHDQNGGNVDESQTGNDKTVIDIMAPPGNPGTKVEFNNNS